MVRRRFTKLFEEMLCISTFYLSDVKSKYKMLSQKLNFIVSSNFLTDDLPPEPAQLSYDFWELRSNYRPNL